MASDDRPSKRQNSKSATATLEAMGDRIASKMNWPTLRGMHAIHRYLIDKYHWMPREVKLLKTAELLMLLEGVSEAVEPKPRKSVSMQRLQESKRSGRIKS